MRHSIGKVVFVIAAVAGLAALMRYLAYGVSKEFGWGFAWGVGLMAPIAWLAVYFTEKEATERARAEMERERSGSIEL